MQMTRQGIVMEQPALHSKIINEKSGGCTELTLVSIVTRDQGNSPTIMKRQNVAVI